MLKTDREPNAPRSFSWRAADYFDFSSRDNRETLIGIISSLKQRKGIPSEDIEATQRNIERAFDEFYSSRQALSGIANGAFYIHSRDLHSVSNGQTEGEYSQEVRDYLADSGRVDPLFKPKNKIPFNVMDLIWNHVPPRIVGMIEGTAQNGTDINMALISVPVTPIRIYGRRAGDGIEYARAQLMPSVEFGEKLGAGVHSLGEAFAAMTDHGRFLQKRFPDLTFTTGHNFTAAFMEETIFEMARRRGKNLSELTVMFHGGYGSICTAVRGDLLERTEVGGVILHDRPRFLGGLQKEARKLMESYPYLDGRILTSAGDECLQESASKADLIVSAVSAAYPTLRPEYVRAGTDIIDDSQPPSTLPQYHYAPNVRIAWVVGALTDELRNTFDYGLYRPGTDEFTCALEGITILALKPGENFETVGKVTNQRVTQAREYIKQMGFTLAPPQNYGRSTF